MRPWYHLNSDMTICTLSIRDNSFLKIIRYRFPFNGGNFRWSLLRLIFSVHSSKATSIPPSRRFSPTIFSLYFGRVCTPPCQRHFVCVRLYYDNLLYAKSQEIHTFFSYFCIILYYCTRYMERLWRACRLALLQAWFNLYNPLDVQLIEHWDSHKLYAPALRLCF